MQSQEKRKRSSLYFVASKKQRKSSTIDKSGQSRKTSINNSANVTSRTTRNNRQCQRSSLTMIKNNRELATALGKARLRIAELEDQGLQFKKYQHELRGKCVMLNNQLQKIKEENSSKQAIDLNTLKGECQSLRLSIQRATEKLLESTVFLGEIDESIDKMFRLLNGESQNCPDVCR
ncbi:uncharacterized protein LOC114518181 [Dendronephthya gigantea]|uniref:uncharacterized protein LOC114518181 n=1 Tax=Dendronephthya gigantea TaxID=151771 RepID=UPI001069E3C9|nr:uncharacterized protein LOC114518181 [Dendronephthya gigantea]